MNKTVMKNFIVITLMMLASMPICAEEKIAADVVEIPQGGQAELVVGFQLNEGHDYVSYQFKVELPDGISLVTDEYNKVPVTLGDGQPAALFTIDLNANSHIVTCYSNPSTRISETEGILVHIPVKVDASIAVGSVLNGLLTGVEFSTIGAVATQFANADVVFKIVENIVVLDETSTIPPVDGSGVDVNVKRMVNANEWTTICLPFAMTAEQVKTAFGDNVILANFIGCEPTEDTDENITALQIKSVSVTEMEANHPYLIYVDHAISEFSVEDVDIVVEDEPSVDCDRIGSGTKRDPYRYNSFVGTYVAETTVPEETMYMAGEQFFYSDGTVKLLGYRGYFDFYDVLSDMDVSARMVQLVVDGTPVGIENVIMDYTPTSGRIYTLSGQFVGRKLSASKLKKGVYIINDKKVVVK